MTAGDGSSKFIDSNDKSFASNGSLYGLHIMVIYNNNEYATSFVCVYVYLPLQE